MNQKILLGWALSATALALLFLGFAVGKRSALVDARAANQAPYASTQSTLAPGAAHTNDAASANLPANPYVIPDAFANLPAEWHSVTNGEAVRGYAILLDVQRREAIVEKCHHRGYVDQRSGKIIEPGWEFCDNVLWGTLTRIDERSATAMQAGKPVELTLELGGARDAPRLSLSFADHTMILKPGSKNDYLQALESTPQIRQQKDRYVRTMVARDQAQRRVAQQTGNAMRTEVPTYALPDAHDASDTQDKLTPAH